MSRENVEAVRRSLDGWNRGDLDAWLEPSHPDVEWSSAITRRIEGTDAVYRGHAEVRRFWDEWHALWSLKIEASEIRDLGDTVLVLGRIQTHAGASGVDLEGPIAYVFQFEDGLARRVHAYLDPQDALEAVGLSE